MKSTMYIKPKIIFYFLTLMTMIVNAQNEELKLWNASVPNSMYSENYKETYDEKNDRLSKVTNPTLTVFVPENPNGTSVIICPGGGYQFLAINKEGYKVAEWLNTLGITAFVLKSRLPSDEIMEDKSVGPLQDAQEAVRYIRRNAEKWNLDTQKIGVIGFSAGGHLAATLSTTYDEVVYDAEIEISAKPNFAMLIYPVISMTNEITHQGSRNRLLGKNPSEELVQKFSAEQLVNADTPPTFLVHAADDKGVVVENSMNYFSALRTHKVIAEMHLFQSGGHGFGLGNKGTSQSWTEQAEKWLMHNQFTNEVKPD
jgi:acetyl esterase/lipase